MNEDDDLIWHDPFAEDEAARERERRRAEREARRRARRAKLGEKVREQQSGTTGAARGSVAAPPADPDPPPAASESTPRITISSDGAGAGRGRSRTARGGPTPTTLWVRRAIALVVLLVCVYGLTRAVGAVVDRLGDTGEDWAEQAATPAVKTREFLIPEGLSRRQIAQTVRKEGIKGNYMAATKKPPKGFPLKRYAPDGAPSLEGFLFPATYELERNATVKDLVAQQLQAFRENFARVNLKYAKSKNLNAYDVIKIASIIEREIAVPKERRLAAAVIYNRLAAGDPLGMDATIRYEDDNWDGQLTVSRLERDTPYNTRTRTGLPPTPIGNPGLQSLKAAANPAKSDAYYFVIKPGTCNEHTFVETAEEFARAEARYQRALQEQGGSPTEC